MSISAPYNPEKPISSQLAFLKTEYRSLKDPEMGVIDERKIYYKPFRIEGKFVQIIERSVIGIALSETDCCNHSAVLSLDLRHMLVLVDGALEAKCNFRKVDELFLQILAKIGSSPLKAPFSL